MGARKPPCGLCPHLRETGVRRGRRDGCLAPHRRQHVSRRGSGAGHFSPAGRLPGQGADARGGPRPGPSVPSTRSGRGTASCVRASSNRRMSCKDSISSARSSTSTRSAAISTSTNRAPSMNRRFLPASMPSLQRASATWKKRSKCTCARRGWTSTTTTARSPKGATSPRWPVVALGGRGLRGHARPRRRVVVRSAAARRVGVARIQSQLPGPCAHRKGNACGRRGHERGQIPSRSKSTACAVLSPCGKSLILNFQLSHEPASRMELPGRSL